MLIIAAQEEARAIAAMEECTRLGLVEAIEDARGVQRLLELDGTHYAHATRYAACVMEEAIKRAKA